MTGTREAVMTAKFWQQLEGEIDYEGFIQSLRSDPYDPSLKDGVLMNKSESVEYDSLFPDHPLTRVRGILKSVEETLIISSKIKQ